MFMLCVLYCSLIAIFRYVLFHCAICVSHVVCVPVLMLCYRVVCDVMGVSVVVVFIGVLSLRNACSVVLLPRVVDFVNM